MPAAASHAANAPVIVWLRQDLRVADNPALSAAVATGRPVLPVFVLDDETPGKWALGGASRWWLHGSLAALSEDLQKRGAGLLLRRGKAQEVIPALARETEAAGVYWNRCYEPYAIARDTALKADLKAAGLEVQSFASGLIFEPWRLKTGQGGAFKVYSPFWRAALAQGPDRELAPTPAKISGAKLPTGDQLNDWRLLPSTPDWAGGLRAVWTPGEAGAHARFDAFLSKALQSYADGRNIPSQPWTSALSPHLHFGEIGPLQIWRAIEDRQLAGKNADKFLAEIGWREFAYHLLAASPELPEKAWKPSYEHFPWRDDAVQLRAWQRGQTGYPIVDAGMRELWTTGWMHNRVRMIVASFLIKHLMIDWRVGQDWFWDTLVDADLANNAASWQWVAGSGADAAPYFRIFNPVSQGETYDPDGAYVRRWVPELGKLPNAVIHKPWTGRKEELAAAGVRLGETYPHPIVDHAAARQRALDAFARLPKAG